MRKFKGLLISVSVAAMLAVSSVPALAEETETVQATEAVSEEQEAAEAASDAVQAVVTDGAGLSDQDQQILTSYAEESIKMITAMSDAEMEEYIHPSSILSVPPQSLTLSVEAWKDARDVLGEFAAVKEHSISVTDDAISINSTCEFSNCDGIITTTLSRDSLSMESMTFAETSNSFGKTMKEAAMNTIMGIGIVFLTLLFLSFLIGQFKHIAKFEESAKKKAAPTPAPAPAAAPAPAPASVEEVSDGELIAVIAAAIAAAEGTSTDGFVVRSIRKSNRSKWQRA